MEKKRELVAKYINLIRNEIRRGKTLEEITQLLEREFSLKISLSYLSLLLKRDGGSRHANRSKRALTKESPKGTDDALVAIYRNSRKIGTLARVDDRFLFAYEPDTPLAERFVTEGVHDTIPPQIENLLPEGINRERLAYKHGLDPKESFELLKHLDDAHGGYSTQPVEKKTLHPFDHSARSYEETILPMESIEVEPDVQRAIEDLFLTGTSLLVNRLSNLSGQQPKTVVSFHDNHLYLPQESEYSNAILKVCNREYRDINIVENMLLSLARFELNIPTEKTLVLIDSQAKSQKPDFLKEKRDHFITSRYDRLGGEPRMASELLSILGKSSTRKYEVSIETIFDTIRRKANARSLRRLAEYYYFSFLAGNGDAHAKNIAFFKQPDGSLEIAPLYDVVNTAIYRIEGTLGISLNNRTEIDHDDLFEFLSSFADADRLHRMRRRFFEHIYDYLEISRPIMDSKIYDLLEHFYRKREKSCKK